MTNYEFLKTASIQQIAKFLLTAPGDEPQDWDKEMAQCIAWLNMPFNEAELNSHEVKTPSGLILL